MGLGTKIKEALSSDKGTHTTTLHNTTSHNTTSQKPRVAPGAYPDSVVDVPRTSTANANARTRTWETTADTNSTKQHPYAAKDHRRTAEDDEPEEYTFSPVGGSSAAHQNNLHDIASGQHETDDLVPPSPDSRLATGAPSHNTAFSKDSSNPQQYPYWGDLGKADTQQEDPVTNAHHLGRNGTISNNNYPTHRDQVSPHGYGDEEKFGAPITATVNHGQSPLVDEEEVRATNMAATQLPQSTEFDRGHGPVDLAYRNAGHAGGNTGYSMNQPTSAVADHYVDNHGVKRAPTTNARGPSPMNAHGAFGSPSWEFDNNAYNANYQPGNKSAQQHAKDREQTASVGSSSNGIGAAPAPKSVASDHYGPGHAAAKVFHRCEHCGNDNDISKYFSKDVVYRLS